MLASSLLYVFFFTDPAATEIYTLSLHDALPISAAGLAHRPGDEGVQVVELEGCTHVRGPDYEGARVVRSSPVEFTASTTGRSEEHTSELQSRPHLVCRLLLEKKKKNKHKDDTIL